MENVSQALKVAIDSSGFVLVNPSFSMTASKIDDPGIAMCVNDDVIRLCISPNNTSPMQCCQGVLNLPDPPFFR